MLARAEDDDDDPTDQCGGRRSWPQNLIAQSQVKNLEVVRFTIVGSFEEAQAYSIMTTGIGSVLISTNRPKNEEGELDIRP